MFVPEPTDEYKSHHERAALVEELSQAIYAQGTRGMDFVRARGYWHTKLRNTPIDDLIPALAEALSSGIDRAVNAEVKRTLSLIKRAQ
jgi:hypothetical protein